MSGVRDRLLELQAYQRSPKSNDKKEKLKPKKNITSDAMDALHERVRKVEAKLISLERSNNEMEKLQKDIVCSPNKKKVLNYEQTVSYIQEVSGKVRAELRELETWNTRNNNEESVVNRVKRLQINNLTNRLAALTNARFKAQAEYTDKMRDKIRRQLEVVGTKDANNITEDEVTNILNKQSCAFTNNFITDVQNAELKLKEMEGRQRNIVALEKSVFELNQLFQDMSFLVQDQNGMLDNIETNTTEALIRVKDGNLQLNEAETHRSNSRRFKLCLAAVVVVVVVVIVLIILSSTEAI